MTSGRFYILLIFITGIVSLELAAAPAAGLEIDDVKVGIADRYKLGRWTPVRFVLNAGDQPWRGSLRISARDGDDAWATLTGGSLSDISLAAGESRQMETYVRIGRQSSDLRIAAQPAEDAGGELIEFVSLPDGLLASQQSILVIGGDVGLRSALRVMPRRTNEEILGTTVEKSDELPNRWFGYDGFDVLVLTTTDDTLYAALSSQQTEAIADWVELGGRLIVTLGASGEEFLQQPTLIGRFTPGDYVRTLPLRQVSALEAYVESSMSLGSTEAGDVRLPPLVTQLTNLQGEVVLSSGRDVPLLVRSAAGFGSVLFVAMDLDAAPLADWEDRHRLLAKLLGLSLSESPASETGKRLTWDSTIWPVNSTPRYRFSTASPC